MKLGQSKQKQWEIFGEKLEENFRENQKLFWGAVKRCRRGNECPIKHVENKQGDVVKNNDEILEVWREYFESLHNPNNLTNIENTENRLNNINSPSENDNTNNEGEITMAELISEQRRK